MATKKKKKKRHYETKITGWSELYTRRQKKTHRQNASLLYRHFGSSPVSSAPSSR